MVTKSMKAIHEQGENFNIEIENMKNYKREIIELKNIITELKISIEGFTSRLNPVRERIS